MGHSLPARPEGSYLSPASASGISVSGFPDSPQAMPYSTTRSQNEFTGGIGASLDIRASNRSGFRLIQVGYLRKGNSTGAPDCRRLSSGIVIQLGRKS
jgi:hypothetical protein